MAQAVVASAVCPTGGRYTTRRSAQSAHRLPGTSAWVTHADVPETLWSDWAERLVVYRPPVGQTEDATTA